MNKFYKTISSPYAIILGLLVVFPMTLILTRSFIVDKTLSLDPIIEVLTTSTYTELMKESFIMAGKTTLLAIIISLPICLTIWRMPTKTKTIIIVLITTPLWINLVARARAMDAFFENFSFISGEDKVVIALALIYLPFMIISINSQLDKMQYSLVESAADLGCNKPKTFYKVVLPLIMPGLLSGINLVLLPSATSIVVPSIINRGTSTIGSLIDNLSAPGLSKYAASIALVLIVIMSVSIFLIEFWTRRVNNEKN